MAYEDDYGGIDLLSMGLAPTEQDKANALMRAVRKQPALTMPSQAPMQQPPVPEMAAPLSQSEQLRQQISAKMAERPDEAALLEMAKRRQEQADRAELRGLELQTLGGERLAPYGGQLLKQAMAAQAPMEIPGGWGTVEGGQVVWNPMKQREAELGHLETQLRGAEAAEARTASAAERRALQQEQLQAKRENAEQQAQLRRDLAAGRAEPVPSLQHIGVTPAGETVSYNPKTGQNVISTAEGPKPYSGPMLSQATLDKQATAVQEAMASSRRTSDLLARVRENPRAFGGMASLAPYTGTFAGARITEKNLSPAERAVRNDVLREAAQVVNDLYGAALSAGEEKRASAFVPNPQDPPEVVMDKLQAAMRWANSKSSMYGTGVRGAAEARMGGTPAAAPAAPAEPAPTPAPATSGRRTVTVKY